MNLLFSLEAAQPFGANKWHGGGKYAEIVFFRMIERGEKFSCYYDSEKWINPIVLDACRKHDITLFDLKKERLNVIIERNKIDVIYTSLLRGEVFNTTKARIIFPIHDMRGLSMPNDWMRLRYRQGLKGDIKSILQLLFHKFWLNREYRKNASAILNGNNSFYAVSYYSKYSLLSFFPELRESDIKVFYSPNTIKNNPSVQTKIGNYFLMVSGNRWIKNSLRAIMALDRLMSENRLKDYKVIVTGARANNFRYKIENKNRFDFIGYVDDKKLTELYANCFAFIYPSLSEGFGYPPVEAMKYGKPVIASPFTAISEICGNAVLYFNPYDWMEIYNRILMLLNNNIYNKLVQKSLERYDFILQKQDSDLDLLVDYITKG